MPTSLPRLLAVLQDMERKSSADSSLIGEFLTYMKDNQKSEAYIKNNIKAIINFAQWLQARYPGTTLFNVNSRDIIRKFLDSKRNETDPDQKWITTWNDYSDRIKVFYRWIHNVRLKDDSSQLPIEEWQTPQFLRIKHLKSKHQSYSANQIWDLEDLQLIVEYEESIRNKAAIMMAWDINARNQDIMNIRIKNIRFFAEYAEGEIPYGKTGTRPILLGQSLPYVKAWYNQHPLKNDSNARFICEKHTGKPLKAEQFWAIMMQLRTTIQTLLENGEIKDPARREKLQRLLQTKRWNPYCFRHSSITTDADTLPEYALRKKAGWSMSSRQPGRYAKNVWTPEIKKNILSRQGIELEGSKTKVVKNICPRCKTINPKDAKVCTSSTCSYPLTYEAYDAIKEGEKQKMTGMQEQIDSIQKFLYDQFKKTRNVELGVEAFKMEVGVDPKNE